MAFQSWLIYLGFVVVATSSPGPAVLFIVTNSTVYGWRKSIFAAIGNVIGLLLLGMLSITGLGTILTNSQSIFAAIKYAGAAYLIYMGIKMILKGNLNFDKDRVIPKRNDSSNLKIFIKAFGVAVSNPKALIFLTALFPQFINLKHPIIPQFSILILVLIISSFTFLMLYALLAHQAKNWLSNSTRNRFLNWIGGTIFIGFGLLLAVSSFY